MVPPKHNLRVSVEPTAEPVTVAEAKAHLRIDFTADDTLIGSLITAARQTVENETGLALMTQTLQQRMDTFPAGDRCPILLARSPIASVSSIAYTDTDGTTQTWAASNYQVSAYGFPPRILPAWGVTWPSTRGTMDDVLVTFVAGYTSATAVPKALKQAILLLVAHWYERREAVMVGGGATELPLAYERLIQPYQVWMSGGL